jgi:hypothetical protein
MNILRNAALSVLLFALNAIPDRFTDWLIEIR